MERFVECFGDIEDPRAANARHDLYELLFIALLASLCGAETCEDYSVFGQSRRDLLARFLTLRHGIPSHDTFSRVFRLLDPAGFERAFRDFMSKFAEGLSGVIALDGKALKRAYDKGRAHAPAMMVSAFAAQTRMTLASLPVVGGNERDAVLYLIDMISLKGATVTADALHAHDEMALAILDKQGHYALRLKENQPILHEAASLVLRQPRLPRVEQQEKRKGDVLIRTARVAPAGRLETCFPGLKAVGCITLTTDKGRSDERLYLLSKRFTPEELLDITRSHWAIENNLHWVLDTAFAEDAARSRKNHAPQNLAIMRRLALNIATLHPEKAPMRRKLKKAAWNETYFLELITHMR